MEVEVVFIRHIFLYYAARNIVFGGVLHLNEQTDDSQIYRQCYPGTSVRAKNVVNICGVVL